MAKKKEVKTVVVNDENKDVRMPSEIVNAGYKLEVVEQNIILGLSPFLDNEGLCRINKYDLARHCGFSPAHANRDIAFATEHLMEKVIKFYSSDDEDYKTPIYITHWLQSFKREKDSDFIEFEVDKKLVPYFKKIHKHYASGERDTLVKFKHQHSAHIYLLVRDQLYKNEVEYPILEFCAKLDIARNKKKELSSYVKLPANLRLKVIEPALKEINNSIQGLNLQVEFLKSGKKITGIKLKWTADEKMKARRTKLAKASAAKKALAQKIENKKMENQKKENQTSLDFDELLEENLAYNEIAYKEKIGSEEK